MTSYGQLTADAVEKLTGHASLLGALSAPAQVTGLSLYEAISGEVGEELTSAVASALPAAVADEASAVAMSVLKFVLTIAQGENVGTAAAELARTALDFVPIFGTVAGMMVDAGKLGNNAHLGIGPASGDKAVRARWCQAQFAPPNGSGPGKLVMPADVFALSSTNADGQGHMMSSLGRALLVMGEPDSVEVYNSAGDVIGNMSIETVRKVANLPGDPLGWKSWANVPTLGIPKDVQALCRTLREAIAAMRNHLETDGGVALMLLLTDVLRVLWAEGRMGGSYFNALMDMDTNWIHAEVRTKGETCFTHDKRGGQAALDLLQGWRQTLNPYAQFSKPEELAAAQGELVGRVQGMLDRNNRLVLLEAALKGGGPRIRKQSDYVLGKH